MSLSIIQKPDLMDFVRRLLPDYRVGGPVAANGGFAFQVIEDPAELRLDYSTTILPPKKFLLPQREVLLKFDSTKTAATQMVDDTPPTVIFGVHTCDIHAIKMLDSVFAKGHVDPYYINHRRKTLIVGIECLSPCDEDSFCKSMGTLSADDGFDLHLTDMGDVYAVDAGTEAGQALLKYAKSRPATQADMQHLNNVLSEKWPRFPYRLDFDVSDLPSLMSMSMKSPLWNELGERCLACAMCTNVCPTCFCFDVKDEVEFDLQHGQRVRVWDSCQLDEFATVVGPHNFRPARAMRQRHRFLRKGKYILEAHGYTGCVGCGRCARACLVDITPVGTWNELNRQREAGGQA